MTGFASLPLVPGVSGLNLYMEFILIRKQVLLAFMESKFSMATMSFEVPILPYRRKVELQHLL